MKRYPSIPQQLPKKLRNTSVHVFDKVDGTNLRFAYEKKRGWVQWGTRNQVVDESHPIYGEAWQIFEQTLMEPLERIAAAQGWKSIVAFAEFWGAQSLGGQHEPKDSMVLTLFDLAPGNKGFLGPESFLTLCEGLPIPQYLGEHVWDDTFVEEVRIGALEGITFEGVVGKVGEGHKRATVKAKTQVWKDRILERLGSENGEMKLAS